MMVAIGLTAVAKAFDRRGQRRVVGDDRPAVAEGTEVLGRVEAEGAGNADRADRTAGGGRQMCLTAILDDREVVARRHPRDRRHVRGLSVQMHWQDCASRSEEHTSELQSPVHLVCRLLLEKKK